MLTDSQRSQLQEDFKYAGFGTLLNQQLDFQSALLGMNEFKLQLARQYNRDRMYYRVEAKQGDKEVFYNGFEATIVKDMPESFVTGNISLKDLETRLSSPPNPLLKEKGQAGEYEKELAKYQGDLIKDLEQLHQKAPQLLYRLAAVYGDVINPMMANDFATHVHAQVNQLRQDGIVRKQWFAAKHRITSVEAHNLMDDVLYQRAVYKTYTKKPGEEAAQGVAGEKPAEANPSVAKQESPAQRERYGTWIMLDYEQPLTKNGNRGYRFFNDEMGFDIREKMKDFTFLASLSDADRNEIAKHLEKGHRIQMSIPGEQKEETIEIFANPARGTLTLMGTNGIPLKHKPYLTEEAQRLREEKDLGQQTTRPYRLVSGASPGQAPGEDDGKKNSRIVKDNPNHGKSQHP